ncbi:coiled-coil-helix-coiled-coil-helix domain-containing protein 7 isoform X2 [Passer domesticus]|uniref:coiled-coil-helix-coiled-coil-helix domain-containing protein 7 isoform X2 n=1 Tax=Passer domesticus TaxID=48849 RepID=UPI0030FE8A23
MKCGVITQMCKHKNRLFTADLHLSFPNVHSNRSRLKISTDFFQAGVRAAVAPFSAGIYQPRYEYLSRMSRHAKKLRDHDINPCLAETDATTKCMDDNNYNKDMCTDYFLKYKNCRKFWHGIMMQRKRSGVKPEMPSAEERKKILESMGKPY